jgi:hypothetical protein
MTSWCPGRSGRHGAAGARAARTGRAGRPGVRDQGDAADARREKAASLNHDGGHPGAAACQLVHVCYGEHACARACTGIRGFRMPGRDQRSDPAPGLAADTRAYSPDITAGARDPPDLAPACTVPRGGSRKQNIQKRARRHGAFPGPGSGSFRLRPPGSHDHAQLRLNDVKLSSMHCTCSIWRAEVTMADQPAKPVPGAAVTPDPPGSGQPPACRCIRSVPCTARPAPGNGC